jgi:hypothetical protein
MLLNVKSLAGNILWLGATSANHGCTPVTPAPSVANRTLAKKEACFHDIITE